MLNPTEVLLGQPHRYRVQRPPIPQRVMAQHPFDPGALPYARRDRQAVVFRDQPQNLDNRRRLEHPSAGPQYRRRRRRPAQTAPREQDVYYRNHRSCGLE
jgi:hypothetical protein